MTIAALVLTLVLAACSGDDGDAGPTTIPTPAPPITEVIRIEKSSLTEIESSDGTCGRGRSQRVDVWECTVEASDSAVLTHWWCFAETPQDTFLLCVIDPFKTEAVRVDLEAPLPPHAGDEGFIAMAVELEDGVRCSFIGGATFVVGDERANFHCDDDSWLIGNPLLADDGSLSWPQCREECSGESPPEEPLDIARAVRVWG